MKTSELKIPSYKIEDCKIGIVHLGVGNFHRAHQALYINNYIEKRMIRIGLSVELILEKKKKKISIS